MTSFLLDGRGIVLPAGVLAAILALLSVRAPIVGLALCAGVLLLALAGSIEQVLLLTLVVAFPWRGLLKYPSEQLSIIKVLGALLVLAFVFSVLRGRVRLRGPAPVVAALVLGLLIALSVAFALDPGASMSKALRYGLFITFFILLVQLTPDRPAVIRIMRLFTLSATLGAIWALVAFLQGDVTRAKGPIEDPVDFSLLLTATLPLAGFLFVQGGKMRWVWGISFVLLLAAALATLSRGAIVGLAALAIWAIVTRKVPITGVVAGILVLAGVAALAFTLWSPLINERLQEKGKISGTNVAARKAFWAEAEHLAGEHPVTGVGPNEFGEAAGRDPSSGYVLNNPLHLQDPVVHNTYLEILVESGAIALAVFLFYLAAVWQLLSRALRIARVTEDKEGQRLATALQAGLVVTLVSATFVSQQLAVPFWILGALGTIVGISAAAPSPQPALPGRAKAAASLAG
jgi:putative inorganic carbon (hco3(-)) transporter